MACDVTRIPGAALQVALFEADLCGAPVYGTGGGYVTDCGDVTAEQITETTRDAVLITCPSGDVVTRKPAVVKTVGETVTILLPELPVEFLAGIGAVNPLIQNGEIVGYDDCGDSINLGVRLIVENLAADGCQPGSSTPPALARHWMVQRARISTDGDRGTSDFRFSIVGESVKVDIGSGFTPVVYNPATPETPEWSETCLTTCVGGWIDAALPDDECGIIDTAAGPACTTGS